MKTKKVTVHRKQKLYVIPCGAGYTCLGWQVCLDRIKALAADLGVPATVKRAGALHNYRELARLQRIVAERYGKTGWRSSAELSPQLVGLEGRRVEVVTEYGETRRFKVGKSTGWIPCHLELKRRDSIGGMAAEKRYKSVRVVA